MWECSLKVLLQIEDVGHAKTGEQQALSGRGRLS